LNPEEARAIVDPALKLMIDAVHRYYDLPLPVPLELLMRPYAGMTYHIVGNRIRR
jgi:hypothetical protein